MSRPIKSSPNYWFILFMEAVSIVSVFAFVRAYQTATLFTYDDSVAYLTVARSVVDNIQPGIEQIGTVWLPVNHLLKLPFIWNDFLYQTSLAGSIVSMLAYVASVVLMFKIVARITDVKWKMYLVVALFAFNPQLLYLQATAMSESLFIMSLLASTYAFIRYVEARSMHWLLVLGLINAVFVLVRYEAWFVVFAQAIAILILHFVVSLNTKSEVVLRLFVAILPSVAAVGLWVAWNAYVTGDGLNFIRGDFGPNKFVDNFGTAGAQPQGDLPVALNIFSRATVMLISIPVLVLSGFSMLVSVFKIKKLKSTNGRLLLVSLFILVTPVVFHIISLYAGVSLMKIDGVFGDVGSLNIRYAIFLLPFIAISIIPVLKNRFIGLIVLILVAVSYASMATTSSLAIIDDAREGQVSYQEPAQLLAESVEEGDKILISYGVNSPFAFETQLELSSFIHEGVYDEWSAVFTDDGLKPEWVVVSLRFDFDPIAEYAQANDPWLESYDIFYRNDDIALLKLGE